MCSKPDAEALRLSMFSWRRVKTFVTELSTPARFSENTMMVNSFTMMIDTFIFVNLLKMLLLVKNDIFIHLKKKKLMNDWLIMNLKVY